MTLTTRGMTYLAYAYLVNLAYATVKIVDPEYAAQGFVPVLVMLEVLQMFL